MLSAPNASSALT
jgi:hypothetical protein